jgi:membrane associated rhomboid family serine protease
MNEPSQDTSSRIVGILSAALAAIGGFLAFNVIDGVFGFTESLIGLAAGIVVTVLIFRRAPRGRDAGA